MRISGLAAATFAILAACGSDGDGGPSPVTNQAEAPAAANRAASGEAPADPAKAAPASSAARWDLQSSGEGAGLVLLAERDRAAIRIFCPAGQDRLLVNVPSFRPIESEERLSFGSGGEAVALVADTRGDRQRGGVSGTGAVPANLAALIAGPVSASYGAQTSGPHPAPPRDLARGLVAACRDRAAPDPAPGTPPSSPSSPCMVQDGQPLRVAPIRAVGTEPFWGARIQGRCVTYSHPEDQQGTRVWTRYTAGAGGAGTWVGALGGRPFELRTRPQPGCSDGMSDRRYPIAVDLLVGGERRTGCAEPL